MVIFKIVIFVFLLFETYLEKKMYYTFTFSEKDIESFCSPRLDSVIWDKDSTAWTSHVTSVRSIGSLFWRMSCCVSYCEYNLWRGTMDALCMLVKHFIRIIGTIFSLLSSLFTTFLVCIVESILPQVSSVLFFHFLFFLKYLNLLYLNNEYRQCSNLLKENVGLFL